MFGEPAGVAGVAGLQVAVQEGIVPSDASVIVVMTGSGLKDTQSARKAVGDPLITDPNLKDLEELLN